MTTCPECGSEIGSDEDVTFVDWDTEDTGLSLQSVFARSSKRLYITACADCGAAIGGGVAGAA